MDIYGKMAYLKGMLDGMELEVEAGNQTNHVFF